MDGTSRRPSCETPDGGKAWPLTAKPFTLRAVLLGSWLCAVCGCTSVLSPISSVPASRLPPELLARPRANLVPLDLTRLRQDPPKEYLLDTGDVLAVYVEGVMTRADAVPPVHFPEGGSEVQPAVGYPVPVRSDGHISLPLIQPIAVRGLTVPQVEERIRNTYLHERQILKPEQDRVLVSLMRERTYRVIVIREDGSNEVAVPGGQGGRVASGSAQTGRGFALDLPAYQNDVLHALAGSGGLPGLNAKNEVRILRGTAANREAHEAFLRQFYEAQACDRCACPLPPPEAPTVTRIALRLPPGETPHFGTEEVILQNGDIVTVESRELEFFYTGGLLPGGQFPLPRDYDLDVLGAIAVAGRGLGANVSGGLIGGLGGANPTYLYVIRRTLCGQQVTIGVDLNRAITNPRERLLLQSGDTLILRHTPLEETANFGIATFFTYGLRQLFTN